MYLMFINDVQSIILSCQAGVTFPINRIMAMLNTPLFFCPFIEVPNQYCVSMSAQKLILGMSHFLFTTE